jgi:transcriptional regulator GlxA family with amidase domain
MFSANKKTSINIALVIYEHVLATSLTLPIEMLRAGEAFAQNKKVGAAKLNIKLISNSSQPISARAGISLLPDTTLNNMKQADVIIAPSLWRNPRPILKKQQDTIAWILQRWQKGATLIGVGTGVCFFAESGLLNEHSATTHWHYVEQFKRDYPKVALKPDFFITQSERIYCAASLNALADIIVHLLGQIYGTATAQHVERNFSHEIRKPYEQQRYLEGAVDRHPDELIAQVQFWMKNNLSSGQNLMQVAQEFGLSQRSFTRRFKVATGKKAMEYWQELKVEMAKELLGASNLSIQEIAFQVGYQDQGHLTRLFKQALHQTPRDYRAMVRKKLFTQE